jgi:tRNA-Thr(GGU) m(6)t(6)A37 methyltransferase TsaA
MSYAVEPIGFVQGGRTDLEDDKWGLVEATIVIGDRFGQESLAGLDEFSHLDVAFLFHRVDEGAVEVGARHPRGRHDWPAVGILAQRAKARPNRLGVTTCELLAVHGRNVRVRGLDAIDGTPVLDIKPCMAEFLPRTPVRQPPWSHKLMKDYW